MKTPARRATTALTSLLVAAAGVVASGAATAPAHAAPVQVTGATFTWDLNNESTSGAFAPGTWNLFSAGRLGDPGESTTLSSASNGATWNSSDGSAKPAGWKAQDGNVTVEDLQTGGAYAQATFASTRTNTAGVNANTNNANPVRGESRLRFDAGTGTLDAEADNASIAWDGDATVVYYSGYSFFYLSDPELTLTGGDGTITATLGGYGTDMNDMSQWVALPDTEVTLADIEGADVTEAGVIATPKYLGVTVTPPANSSPQTAAGAANHGSFPQSFVTFQGLVGTASYWYSSGGAADVRKPTNPFTVTAVAAPSLAASTTSIAAPAKRFGQAAFVSVTVAGSQPTSGTVTLTGLGAARTAAVVNGRATFALGKPAARAYALVATYSGNDAAVGSSARTTLTVSKAATAVTTRVAKKPTRKKAGKLRVTVASATTVPTGKVRVVLKKGTKTFKTVNATLKNRTATVALPTKAKGAYRAVVTYAGNANVAGSTRAASYRITR